jgi:hypothetical protein
MAVDKAIDSTEFDSKLTTVADAIRTAGGTTDTMSFPTGMIDAISSLSSGGGGTEELSALLKIFGCSELRAPSTLPVYGFFAYMPPFVLLENDSNTTVALQYNGVVHSYSYKTSNSFTQDGRGFVFENNTLIIDLYYLCNITDATLDSMSGMKVLLMGGNVQ